MTEKRGLYSIFKYGLSYRYAQNLVWGNRGYYGFYKDIADILATNVNSTSKINIVDIGCGDGMKSLFLAQYGNYFGVDYNKEYIEYAKFHYGHLGTFLNCDITSAEIKNCIDYSQIDVVCLFGLLHHLSDNEATSFLKKTTDLLPLGTIILTLDPVILEKKPINNYIARKDRGPFARSIDGYKSLFPNNIEIIKTILKQYIRIPSISLVMAGKRV
ncbi:class I SAM-dependent methyltransferase [Cloacibacillus porcorum]|mgnify:CR=1 FL=1|uniref:class I SAM-dependent methyltransferase n=1 Tax=Cloacibacillus porcorum TaxID=1197717 RepID=UPI0014592428|nr:class I SAM-dependent methyltransferase [Cloacibacillus porcorum]MDY5389736.1 class I SAM-dependent methyltransferase [Cloacibacillus porcorum]NMF17583.1 class I SAM-dependent methyltransferase [Cloacibacillus porcorum]